jgi:two-component system, chemotaxis family, response regulator Rcp1
LSTATPSTGLQVLSDGSELIPYLRREGDHAGARRPDLILLDLNLPGRHGRQALADIKGDPDLRRIPVVVLTVSEADEDVVQ